MRFRISGQGHIVTVWDVQEKLLLPFFVFVLFFSRFCFRVFGSVCFYGSFAKNLKFLLKIVVFVYMNFCRVVQCDWGKKDVWLLRVSAAYHRIHTKMRNLLYAFRFCWASCSRTVVLNHFLHIMLLCQTIFPDYTQWCSFIKNAKLANLQFI